MESTERPRDIEAALNAGALAAEPHVAANDRVQVLTHVLPNTDGAARVEHTLIDFEGTQDHPRQRRGTVRVADLDSFLAYLDDHKDDRTTVWVSPDGRKMIGVLDDHAPGEDDDTARAGWGRHRVEYDLMLSPEWEFWKRLDGDLVEQETFAEHIEDGSGEIVNPNAATMLEVATYFQATRGGAFKSAKLLTSGAVQLTNDVEVAAKAGVSGQLEVPSEFELAIAPYVGGQPYKVRAHFRYRIPGGGGSLRLGYKLVRPADILRDARDELAAKVREAHPRTFLGTPRGVDLPAVVS